MRLIYFSPVNWSSYAQRPHFMCRFFLARGGMEVLWIDPYPGRLPKLADLRRSPGLHDQGTSPDSRVRVLKVRALPLEPLPGGFWVNRTIFGRQICREIWNFACRGDCILGIGKPSALALAFLRTLHCRKSFYDAMDDFPEFHRGLSRAAMLRREQAIAASVDQILVSSTYLEGKFSQIGTPIIRIANACDSGAPALIRQPIAGKPVLGYIGSIGEWFDWECLLALAKRHVGCTVRLIGPLLSPPPLLLPENVEILPPCRHEEVGVHLKDFAAGLIPFKKSPLTRGVDPIKYYEYRALGLPVLSTSFGEMAYRGPADGVFFLDDPAGPTKALEAALTYRPELRGVQRWRQENTWWARFCAARLFD